MSGLNEQALKVASDAIARSPIKAIYERADDIAAVALEAAAPAIRKQEREQIEAEARRKEQIRESEQVLEEVREKAALLQKWARTKRREAKDVSGPIENLKLEWVAKGYDGAADLILATLAALHPDQSKGER